MRAVVAMFCLWSAAALADAPATPAADKALGMIQAGYTGTWTINETGYATDFSHPGTKQYELTRDCTLAAAALDCKLMAQGTLQGEQRFTWDAASHGYHVEMTIGGRPQPLLTLTVKDSTWTLAQTLPGPDGKPIQLRILRQYHSAGEVSYSASYSRDGLNWTVMSRGTEILKPAAQ